MGMPEANSHLFRYPGFKPPYPQPLTKRILCNLGHHTQTTSSLPLPRFHVTPSTAPYKAYPLQPGSAFTSNPIISDTQVSRYPIHRPFQEHLSATWVIIHTRTELFPLKIIYCSLSWQDYYHRGQLF